MSLVFMSGWETIKNMDSWLWTMGNYAGASNFSTTIRRGPSYAFYFANANEWLRRVLPTSTDEIYFQTCYYWTTAPSAGTLLRVGKNVNIYFTLYIDANRRLNIYTGDTSSLVATGTTLLQVNRWYVIEVYFKRNASGTISVKIDGVDECSWNGDTTLSISTTTAVSRMKLESGAFGVDTIGTLPNWTVTGSPVASTTHLREGASSMLTSGTSQYISINDADLPAGYLLKNGDITQRGTFMYWHKPTTVPGSSTYWTTFQKYDYAGNNVCFAHEMQNGGVLNVQWCTGSSGHTLETTATKTLVAGGWYHISWSFNGPNKRWDMRVYDLFNGTMTAYSRDCTNVLRTNCTAPYVLASASPGFYDDLIMFNSVLPDWSQDCIRSVYYDPLLKGQDPYTVFQNNWMLEARSTSAATYIDDVIVHDSNGSINNSWVDRAHIALLKTIGPGSYSDFSLSETSATAGSDLVKRIPPTPIDFIYSNVAGTCHTFTMYNTPLKTTEVLAVMESICTWRTANAGLTCQLMMKAGNTIYVSSNFIPPNAPVQENYVLGAYLNMYPDLKFQIFESGTGSLFSASELDNLEIGLKVV
jgi:hypothetical protein